MRAKSTCLRYPLRQPFINTKATLGDPVVLLYNHHGPHFVHICARLIRARWQKHCGEDLTIVGSPALKPVRNSMIWWFPLTTYLTQRVATTVVRCRANDKTHWFPSPRLGPFRTKCSSLRSYQWNERNANFDTNLGVPILFSLVSLNLSCARVVFGSCDHTRWYVTKDSAYDPTDQ